MAIQSVQVYLNGTWYPLTYNSSTSKYEATITAPGSTSYNLTDHVYPMQIKATNTAGTVKTADVTDATVGTSLKLRVKEIVKPTISISSPGAGAYVTNNKQPIVFQALDESGGSGINQTSMALKIDGGTEIAYNSAGMSVSAITNGYSCTYTPQTALSDGSHTVTIDVSDNDGNAATEASVTYQVDTVAPTLNVSNPANAFITNTSALTVQGSTNDATSSPVTIAIKLNGTDQGTVSVTSGSFSKALTLANGSNTIVVTATDAAGKTTTVTLTGTLDTSIPVISSAAITPNPADTGASLLISVAVNG